MDKRPSSDEFRRIGLVFNPSLGYMRDVLSGIFRYMRQSHSWRLFTDGFKPFLSERQLSSFDGDGILSCGTSPGTLGLLREIDLPVVDVSTRFVTQVGYGVITDGNAMGRQAAEHLLGCGLSSFAVVVTHWPLDEERVKGFVDTIEAAGSRASRLDLSLREMVDDTSVPSYEVNQHDWDEFLHNMKLPAGVFTLNPSLGCAVLQACRGINQRVPDEVAVVCASDDQLICESAEPPLSAVRQPGEQIGYQAASMLDRLIDGESVDPAIKRLQPLGVTARQSTDLIAVEDEDVALALRLIRDSPDSSITVKDVLEFVPISRKSLELKFKRALGCTPGEEIRRRRLEHAKALLIDSDLQISDICYRSGFNSRQVFSTAFRKATGKSPRQWREHHRGI